MLRYAVRNLAITSLLALQLTNLTWAQPEEQPTPAPAVIPATSGTTPALAPAVRYGLYEERLPENTQVYLFAPAELPYPELTSAIERLTDNPLGDYLIQELVNELGEGPVSLLRDVIPSIRGNLLFAITRPGDLSFLETLRQHENQGSPYDRLARQVNFLGREVAVFKNKYKRLPNSWQEMVDKKIRKTLPVNEHGQFTLTADGSDWVVSVNYTDPQSPLAKYAAAPTYRGRRGLIAASPVAPPLHAVLAFDTASPQKVREAFSSASWSKLGLTVVDSNNWQLACSHCTPWKITIRNNQVLMSDDPELLASLTEAGPGQAAPKKLASLRDNPRFRNQYAKLHGPSNRACIEDAFVFIDVKDLISSTPRMKEELPDLQPLSSVGLVSRHQPWDSGPAGGPPSKMFPKIAYSEAFLELQGPANSPLTPANTTVPPSLDFVGRLPAQTQVTYAVHIGELARLSDVVGNWFPMLKDIQSNLEKTLEEELEGKLVFSDLKSGLGWATSESEYFSQLVNAGYTLIWGTRRGSGDESKMTKALSLLSGTSALEVKDPQYAESLCQKFASLVPSVGNPTVVGSYKYWVNPDGLFAFVQLPDRLLISSRPTKPLMYRQLEVLAGRGSRISDEPYFGDFVGGLSGRTFMFFHEKVDGPYAILKGILLLIDSDFRPDAEAVGSYRDAYGAASVESDGLHFFGAVYPTAPIAPNTLAESTSSKDLLRLVEQLRRVFKSPLPKKR